MRDVSSRISEIRARKFKEMMDNISKIKYDDSNETYLDIESRYEAQFHDPDAYKSERFMRYIESWHGGYWYGNVRYPDEKQFLPYCEKFNRDLKERVRAYWGYMCVECGALQTSVALSVHHIHYNKKACCDGSPRDLVPLCRSCHSATNHNRDYWERHLTDLIYRWDPSGKCFFTKDEMIAYNNGLYKPYNAILKNVQDLQNFNTRVLIRSGS